MPNLPPELQQFAALLDAQPAPVQVIFRYCLCLLMVETGKARLVETIPSESGPVCTFETIAGDRFSIPKPAMNPEQEAALRERLRNMLDEGSI